MKKHKKYNDYIDNSNDRIKERLLFGFVMAVIFGIVYGVYKIVDYLFCLPY